MFDGLRRAHWYHRLFVPVGSVVYMILMTVLGGPRPEHYILVGLALFFSLWSDTTRKFARVVHPYLLYAIIYDSMRYYEDYIRSPVVHTREPYDFDLHFFAIGGMTPNEWWQNHTHAILDFVCGLAYTPFFFIGESILLSIFLLWKHEQRRAERFVWVFVITNVIGFSCYYIYPAAPPWYVADHGFGVDMSVRASAAGALRFDKVIGFPFMESFYGKSADVFGAIPSLHVVYPFLAMMYGWIYPRFRKIALPYFLFVCFSAVYLNHHYLLDIFIGLGLALVVMVCARAFFGALVASEPEQAPHPIGTEPLRN